MTPIIKDPTDRLGYYLVGKKKFYNKTLALLENYKTRRDVVWIFNNDVYGAIDWTRPVEESLASIYRRRAQQLRDSYDYLSLHFSGGADSMNILHAFIDNGIFLDEIVMQRPKSFENKNNISDTSNANFYSEIFFSAEPHLRKYANLIDPRTKIRIQDLETATIEMLKKDNWFDDHPMGGSLSVSLLGKQMLRYTDSHILDFCYKGLRVAEILGIDKPLVTYENENYYAFFLDLSAYHYNVPIDYTATDIFNKHYCTEFFYWTPDMPELVVKQAQLIKQAAEVNPVIKDMLIKTRNVHIDHFRDVIQPIIYPSHVQVTWRTDKPGSQVIRPMDDWFWSNTSKDTQQNYLQVIDYLKKNIDKNQGINRDLYNGLAGHSSPKYLL
jgi:hypothetical protein